jgi:hypothetical protein
MSSSPSFLTLEPPNAVEFEELMKALRSLQDVPNVDLYKQIADFLNENPVYHYSVVDFFCSHASISIRNSEFRKAMSLTCQDPSSRLFEMVTTIHMEISSIIALDSVQKKLKKLNFEAIIRECLKNDAFLSQLETHFFAIQQEQQEQQKQQDEKEQQILKDFREKKQKNFVAFGRIILKKSERPVPFIIPAVDAVKPEPYD